MFIMIYLSSFSKYVRPCLPLTVTEYRVYGQRNIYLSPVGSYVAWYIYTIYNIWVKKLDRRHLQQGFFHRTNIMIDHFSILCIKGGVRDFLEIGCVVEQN